MSHALERVAPAVGREASASKRAWPLVANGLPAGTTAGTRTAIADAAESAEQVRPPALFEQAQAASLTGPAAELAGLFRTYVELAARAWSLIDAAIDEAEHGSRAGARFARQNVALYIETVYDAQFILAQIGKHLLDDYHKLGGPDAFAGLLTQQQVDALAETYSEATDRLHPHSGVRLGS